MKGGRTARMGRNPVPGRQCAKPKVLGEDFNIVRKQPKIGEGSG